MIEELSRELGFRKTPESKTLHARMQAMLSKECQDPSTKGHLAKLPEPSRTSRLPSPPSIRIRTRKSRRQTAIPTIEQSAAIDAFLSGGSLRINAFAGSGKTSTLQMLAQATAKRGQYIAFNRAIVADAKARFPSQVNCSTIHGLAFQATPTAFRTNRDKMMGKVNAHKLVELLNLTGDWRIDSEHTLKPLSQAAIILRTLRNYTS